MPLARTLHKTPSARHILIVSLWLLDDFYGLEIIFSLEGLRFRCVLAAQDLKCIAGQLGAVGPWAMRLSPHLFRHLPSTMAI